MLRRIIPVHRLTGLSLITCRASSIGPPPTISRLAPTCSHRRRHQRLLSDSPAATAASKDRRWVMLNSYGHRRRPDDSADYDAHTVAESLTSKGRRVRVSFRCAAPPSSSYLYYDFPDRESDDSISVVASHGELVLLAMAYNPRSGYSPDEYFLYRPSAGAGRPPSLSLLRLPVPDPDFLTMSASRSIRLLLTMGLPKDAICVGDRFLCWLGGYRYELAFLACDMADKASPKVRSVGLPQEVSRCSYGDIDGHDLERVQRMGVAGDSRVRLVSIHPYCCRSVDPDNSDDDDHDCCCRGPRTDCWHHPRFVFTIKTWTMNLAMDDDEPLEWVEDGEMNGEEIRALPGYQGLPHAIAEWPVVCVDEDNVVCFSVSDYHFTRDGTKVWMVQLNISTKTLLSVAQFPNNYHCWMEYYHLPAQLQY